MGKYLVFRVYRTAGPTYYMAPRNMHTCSPVTKAGTLIPHRNENTEYPARSPWFWLTACDDGYFWVESVATHLDGVDPFAVGEKALRQVLRRERRRVQADLSVHRTRHDHLCPSFQRRTWKCEVARGGVDKGIRGAGGGNASRQKEAHEKKMTCPLLPSRRRQGGGGNIRKQTKLPETRFSSFRPQIPNELTMGGEW